MKNLAILFVLGIGIIFSGCTEDLTPSDETLTSPELKGVKKPIPTMVGTGEFTFTWTPPFFWNGTVDFGDQGEYKIAVKTLSDPKGFSMASPFLEKFYIYDINETWPLEDEEVFLIIDIKGVLVLSNNKAASNGKVIAARGPLADWMNCNAHTNVTVSFDEFGTPGIDDFMVRIN